MNIIPTVIEKTYNGERVYDLYSRLLNDRIIFLSGEVTNESASIIISELLYLDAINHDDIYLYINSPGGSVSAGLAIFDTMNFIKSDIQTIVVGMAASMGAFLLAAGTKGKRYALPNSEIMIHEVLGGAEGQATVIKLQAERILKLKDKMNALLAKLTGKSISRINKDTERDNFMSAREALDYGLIDAIMEKESN